MNGIKCLIKVSHRPLTRSDLTFNSTVAPNTSLVFILKEFSECSLFFFFGSIQKTFFEGLLHASMFSARHWGASDMNIEYLRLTRSAQPGRPGRHAPWAVLEASTGQVRGLRPESRADGAETSEMLSLVCHMPDGMWRKACISNSRKQKGNSAATQTNLPGPCHCWASIDFWLLIRRLAPGHPGLSMTAALRNFPKSQSR